MKTYFRLYPFCKLNLGKNTNICDFSSQKIWEIDAKNVEILERAEKNIPIVKNDFFDNLVKQNMGAYYSSPVAMDSFVKDNYDLERSYVEKKVSLEEIFLSVTSDCSLRCRYCTESMNRMTGCRWHNQEDKMSKNDYKKLVQESSIFGCKKISFIGGDPLINKETVLDIIEEKATEIRLFTIYTNGSLFDDEFLTILSKYKNVLVQLQLVSTDTKMIEEILEKVRVHGIKARATIVVSPENQDYMMKLLGLCKEYGIESNLDALRNYNYKISVDSKLELPIIQGISLGAYYKHNIANSCLAGKIAIMSNGDCLPCPMMDKYILGNIYNNSLSEILESDVYQEIIHFNKVKQEECKWCGLKSICFDCRALEFNKTGNIHTNSLCTRI